MNSSTSLKVSNIIDITKFSGKQDKAHSKEKGVLSENVLALENLVRVQNGWFSAELEHDLVSLSKTELRKKYKHEESTHRNRKSQCRGKFAPEFQDFRSFLAHVGVCPHPGWTLDRIDNDNPDYGPGLVRWASKKTQTRNRSNTIVLVIDGQAKPLAEWAEITSQSPDRLRKRYQRNPENHREVVYGRTPAASSPAESEWRSLLPERAWKDWAWFERYCLVDGNHLPPPFRAQGAEWLEAFAAGSGGRALRLCCLARRKLSELNAAIYEAEMAHEYGGPEPAAELVERHSFWVEALDRASFKLGIQRGKQ